MFYITLFLLIMVFCSILLFGLNRYDIASPEVIFTNSMMLSSLFYILLEDYWISDISVETFTIMLMGTLTFIFTCVYFRSLSRKLIKKKETYAKRGFSINRWLLVCVIILSALIIVCSFHKIYSVGGTTIYRELRVSHEIEGMFIVDQVAKFINASLFIIVYVLVHNYVASKNEKLGLSIFTVLFALFALVSLSLGRQVVIETILFTILVYLIKSIKFGSKIQFKFWVSIVSVFCFMFPLFYYGASLVGRDFDRISQESPITYVGRYLSCGIDHFNRIVKFPCTTEYFGQSSFAAIYKKILIGNFLPRNVKDMFFHDYSEGYGTTVTIFGRWYEDFGTVGVFIMSLIVAALFSYFYWFVLKKTYVMSDLFCIIYAYSVQAIVWAGYDDRIMQLVSLNFISKVICFCVTYYILLGYRIRVKIYYGN